jgi:ABC-type branched-subunit amino acid transport system substrate-binding protein
MTTTMRIHYLVLALAIGGAACGKDESRSQPTPSGSATPGPSAGGGVEGGVTPTEIVIGQAAAFSGPSAGLGVEMWRGASAAFDEANAKGGIHGRKIRLVLSDDGYESEKAAPAVVKLIEQDKVFALFGGVGTPTIVKALPVVLSYFKKNGLFYFANFTGAMPQREPPYFEAVFNVRASYRQETKAAVDAFVAMGRKKIGTFVQDDAYGTDGREGVKLALKDHGLELIADTRYPRGQKYDVSNAASVKILRDAGVDAVIMVGAYQACGGMVRDLRTAGLDVPIHNVSFVGADQMRELLLGTEKSGAKVLTNLINTQVVPHPDETGIPLVTEYRAAIDKFAPQNPPGFTTGYTPKNKYSFGSLEGYLSARTFLAILDKNGPELTRQSFYRTAEGMGQFELGLGVPAELSPTRHQALDKVWFTIMTPQGWKQTDDPAAMMK